jgi:hypothetical protein
MMRSSAVAVAILAAIDFLMFGGAYMYLVKQIADSFLHHMPRRGSLRRNRRPVFPSASHARKKAVWIDFFAPGKRFRLAAPSRGDAIFPVCASLSSNQ